MLAGLTGIVLHPTFASLAGARWSAVWAAICLMLLLPALTRIVVVPFMSIMLATAMSVVVTKSPTAVAFGFSAYALFFMISYRTDRFYTTCLAITGISIGVASLQFLFPFGFLNFHATAESVAGFLNQYRPTSIFPSQAYYNQLLLALVPLFFLAKERRAWVLFVAGAAAAMTGSTAGIAFAFLALFLVRSRGQFALLGFAALYVAMAIFYPRRLAYNFSIDDVLLSLGSRIIATGDVAALPTADGAIASAPGHPTLMIAVEVLAIVGLILIPMVAAKVRIGFSKLSTYAVSLGAIIVGQMIHPTMGSLYFSVFLAILVALAWHMFGESRSGTANQRN